MAMLKKKQELVQKDQVQPKLDYATLNPDGRAKYKRQLEHFATLNDDDKLKSIRETWKEVAMVAATRAKQLASTCAAKDFGKLYQLIMSSAISLDKAFPPKKEPPPPAPPPLVFNLFGSLGQRAVSVVTPQTPEVVTVQAKELPPSEGDKHGEVQAP